MNPVSRTVEGREKNLMVVLGRDEEGVKRR
jgi:hypothetical protein